MQIYRCRAGCHGIFLQWNLSPSGSVHEVEPTFICTLIPTIQHESTTYRYAAKRIEMRMRAWLLCYGEICRNDERPEPNPNRCWEPFVKRCGQLRDVEVHIITLNAYKEGI